MWSKKFWKAAAERAVKSFAQGVITTVVAVGQLGDVEKAKSLVNAAPWEAGAGMAVLSILMSIVSASASGDPDSPSLVAGDH